MNHCQVQGIAKNAMKYARQNIKPGMSISYIRKMLEDQMLESGADSFWYYNIGAFIFSGEETSISISGKEYVTPDTVVKENDIITIDLSPQVGRVWGDYARTVVIEGGAVVENIENIKNDEWRLGLQTEDKLHNVMREFITFETTFDELFHYMNDYIISCGYVNLDFLGNLGHSIVKNKFDRIYIEKGNKKMLSDVKAFTFEPHIALPNSKYGFKKENIYYFNNGELMEL